MSQGRHPSKAGFPLDQSRRPDLPGTSSLLTASVSQPSPDAQVVPCSVAKALNLSIEKMVEIGFPVVFLWDLNNDSVESASQACCVDA